LFNKQTLSFPLCTGEISLNEHSRLLGKNPTIGCFFVLGFFKKFHSGYIWLKSSILAKNLFHE